MRSTAPVEPSHLVKDLVLAAPHRARLLDRLHLDYFCRGDRTLDEACIARGLDAATVATVVEALDHDAKAARHEVHDVARATTWDLCAHLVTAHHAPLRAELRRITGLAAIVARVHHDAHSELRDVHRLLLWLRQELERHLTIEETVVFPACCRVEEGSGVSVDRSVLVALEDDHGDLCDTLAAVSEICGGYERSRGLCSTHRELLHALGGLELELHQHIHEENNVLFPRIPA
jgi:regulator of cell morphogenesis and NO signaling